MDPMDPLHETAAALKVAVDAFLAARNLRLDTGPMASLDIPIQRDEPDDPYTIEVPCEELVEPKGHLMAFPAPRPVGVCKIPPHHLKFSEYIPALHGPLVNCSYDTAAYPRW